MSHLLYQRRTAPYYVEPIVVGLEEIKATCRGQGNDHISNDSNHYNDDDDDDKGDGDDQETMIRYKPFLCAQDVIGAQSKSHAFVCSGVAKKSLYGCAESLWRPNLSSKELVQVCGKAFLSALERDCLSGYGAVLYLMEGGKGIQEIQLSCRND
jgi:20S proteasome, alpha and beta subunits